MALVHKCPVYHDLHVFPNTRMTTDRPPRSRQKLSDVIVEDVKRWIVAERKQPGDRLPPTRRN